MLCERGSCNCPWRGLEYEDTQFPWAKTMTCESKYMVHSKDWITISQPSRPNSQGYGLEYIGVEFTSGGDCTKKKFLWAQIHKMHRDLPIDILAIPFDLCWHTFQGQSFPDNLWEARYLRYHIFLLIRIREPEETRPLILLWIRNNPWGKWENCS